MAYNIKINRFLSGSLNRLMSMQIKASRISSISSPILYNRSRLMIYGGIFTTAFGASYMLSSNPKITRASDKNINLC